MEEAEEQACEIEGERDESESGFTIPTVSSAADEPTSISMAELGGMRAPWFSGGDFDDEEGEWRSVFDDVARVKALMPIHLRQFCALNTSLSYDAILLFASSWGPMDFGMLGRGVRERI